MEDFNHMKSQSYGFMKKDQHVPVLAFFITGDECGFLYICKLVDGINIITIEFF